MKKVSLAKARELAKQDDFESALLMCNQLLADDPGDHEAIRVKTSVLEKLNRSDEAVASLATLAQDSGEPADYFNLAMARLKRKEFCDGIAALESLLAISAQEQFDYYVSSAKFLRAFALIEIGRNAEASTDIQTLESDMRLWIPGHGLVTIEQLKRGCSK
jgi:tetratricopeptide (TPR) repeat protein